MSEPPDKVYDPIDVSMALRNAEPAIDCFRLYMEALIFSILSIPGYAAMDPKDLLRKSDFKKLCDHDALRVFLKIWRTSSFPTDEAFALAGIQPGRFEPCFNINSLALVEKKNHSLTERLAEEASHERFVNNVKRIVVGGCAFGFLMRDDSNPRCQNVEATRLLHDMIMRYSLNYNALQLRLAGALKNTGP